MKNLIATLIFLALGTSAEAFFGLSAAVPKPVEQNLLHQTSFEQDWFRYPSPDSIFAQFIRTYPTVAENIFSVSEGCRQLTDENRSLLGDSSTLSGSPSVPNPNSAFANWYLNCVKEYTTIEESAFYMQPQHSIAELGQTFSKEAISKCYPGQAATDSIASQNFYCVWQTLGAAEQLAMVNAVVLDLVGPDDVLKDIGLEDNTGDYGKTLLAIMNDSIKSDPTKFSFLLSTSGHGDIESLEDAYKVTKFLIALSDPNKY